MMVQCRSCDNSALKTFLSFGEMPLANRLLKPTNLILEEPLYPLDIAVCSDCGLTQLTENVPPNVLFDEYVYFSSNSETMLLSSKKLVDRLMPSLNKKAKIIEIASNDGYLLKNYLVEGFLNVTGIEPAKNIAEYANHSGVNTISEYFSFKLAQELSQKEGKAEIIHANNVMAHVPSINDFVQGLKILLSENGRAIIEVPYLKNLIEHCEFDTIYHEHVFYFSVLALKNVFEKHDLEIFNIEKLSIHGGSLRVYVGHKNCFDIRPIVNELLNEEKDLEIDKFEYFSNFKNIILNLKKDLLDLLTSLKSSGHRIAAYGASAKGSTLLNYFGIGSNFLDFVVDRNIHKHGLHMAGNKLPIYAPQRLIDHKIPYTLLLTWNFSEEILHQQKQYRDSGGKFIIPIPRLQVV